MSGRRRLEDAVEVAERLRGVGVADLDVTGALDGGETGVFGAQDDTGHEVVFKWSEDPAGFSVRADAHEVTDALRSEAGWPLPRQRLITLEGLQVIVMDRLDGTNPEVVDRPLVEVIAQMDGLRRGLAVNVPNADRTRFGTEIVTTLIYGGNGYCRHELLQSHSSATRRLEQRMVEIGRSFDPGEFPADDLVHFDLSTENILTVDGRLTGIVDPEFALVGDGGFDIVTLAICARELDPDDNVRSAVWDLVTDRVDPAYVAPYAAHVLLRCADWDIRNHSGRGLGSWIDEAERLLFA